MTFSKSLIYPTSNIRNEGWLKNVIFFWDEINIVVSSLLSNSYQCDTTSFLHNEGMLKTIKIDVDNNLINCLTLDMLNYINTNEGFQLLAQGQGCHVVLHRNKISKELNYLLELPPDKVPYEIQYQLRDYMNRENWFLANSNFSNFYMTLLVNRICEQKSISLLTDNPLGANLTDKIRLDNQVIIEGKNSDFYKSNKNEKHINLGEALLINMIIKNIRISKQTSIEDILIFKKLYQEELTLFKINILKLANNITRDISFNLLKQQIHYTYYEEFLPSYNNLTKTLDSYGIKWTTETFIKVSVISTNVTALSVDMVGLGLPQALLVDDGVSLISSLVSYNINKKEKLRENPYSYLFKLNNHILAD
jgi:hypothetical protein